MLEGARTVKVCPHSRGQVQRHKRRALKAREVQQVQREIQDLTAHAAETHEEALAVVEAHHSAAAVRGLCNQAHTCLSDIQLHTCYLSGQLQAQEPVAL